MTTSRNTAFRVILILLPTLVCSIILAVFFVYVSYHVKNKTDFAVEGDFPIQADAILGFKPVPDSEVVRVHKNIGLKYTVATNIRGARVSSLDRSNREDSAIVAIGGSFTWGHGIENENTFVEQVAKALGYTALNFSYGGYGTVQALQTLEKNSDLTPKYVLYGFIDDHLRRNVSPCAPSYTPYCIPVSYADTANSGNAVIEQPKYEYSQIDGKKFYDFVLDKSIGLRDIPWGASMLFARINKELANRKKDDMHLKRAAMDLAMTKMQAQAREMNAQLVVIHIPPLTRNDINGPPAELTDSLDQDTIFVDFSEAAKKHYIDTEAPPLYLENDGHPNELAHELIATEILEALGR